MTFSDRQKTPLPAFRKNHPANSKIQIPRAYSVLKFIDENGGGPGVRLRKRLGTKKPK